MEGYLNIPSKYIKKLAKANKVLHSGREINDVISDLIEQGHKEKLEYLENQFRFTSSNLSIFKPDSNFPTKSATAEKFIETLISERVVEQNKINTEWQPALSEHIKLCSVAVDGSDVYLKMVERKSSVRKTGWRKEPDYYAYVTSAVIHFSDKVIELRCAYSDRKKYAGFIMKLMGFPEPYKWTYTTIVTKEEAKQMCDILSAGLSSTQIAIPSTVGSMRFNGKKNINLRNDDTFSKIKNAITQVVGLPTDDTMDETCFFKFEDSVTEIEIDVAFEVNLKNGGFKFTKEVTEKVYEHVLEAYIYVCYILKQQNQVAQSAAGEGN
ncbi:hypothetical protein [Cytobacillus firmus]|uniref:Uncharacterized protein n=1 Tax=Cytobacillus firmus DS1 TaxID=1307436 RepID=W7L2T3_CYTFI|nr:hypothetical protein [Cytobacillus firmus]EWG12708.1 hypothetical protein PBF_04195 [Cytobacillus firmus DS1]